MTEFTDIPQNLEILAEECAEVIRIKSKAIRFGIDDYHPKNGMSNRDALSEECGHVIAMIRVLVNNGVLDPEKVEAGAQQKLIGLRDWYLFDPSQARPPISSPDSEE